MARLVLGPMMPLLFYGNRCLFLGVKWSGCEVDHLQLVLKLRMSRAIRLLLLYASWMWTGAKHYSLAASHCHYQHARGPLKHHFYVTHTVHFLIFNVLTNRCTR